jgi:hypothetical protein
VRRADFRLGGRLVRRDRAAPFGAKLGRSRLRSGRINRLTALALLKDGRTVRFAGRVRVCAAS